jgi:hypothetical protein
MKIYIDKYPVTEIGYKDNSIIDTGMYFAPYIPGQNNTCTPSKPTTQFQHDLMKSLRECPKINYVNSESRKAGRK